MLPTTGLAPFLTSECSVCGIGTPTPSRAHTATPASAPTTPQWATRRNCDQDPSPALRRVPSSPIMKVVTPVVDLSPGRGGSESATSPGSLRLPLTPPSMHVRSKGYDPSRRTRTFARHLNAVATAAGPGCGGEENAAAAAAAAAATAGGSAAARSTANGTDAVVQSWLNATAKGGAHSAQCDGGQKKTSVAYSYFQQQPSASAGAPTAETAKPAVPAPSSPSRRPWTRSCFV